MSCLLANPRNLQPFGLVGQDMVRWVSFGLELQKKRGIQLAFYCWSPTSAIAVG